MTTQAWTNDKSSADLVFDPNGNMGASSVIDLGAVDFDNVDTVPDSGYVYETQAIPGHVYIILTHDGKYAKIQIQSVLASNILFKYALLDQVVNKPGGPVDSTGQSSVIQLQIGATDATVNGQEHSMPVAPVIVNSRTLVPLRFVSENFKQQIAYDATTRTITITGQGATPPPVPPNPQNDLQVFFHTFKLIVPGSVTDGQAHAGADAGVIQVNSDGTYEWISPMSGDVTGKWVATGDPDYPILIENGEEQHDWKLGRSTPTLGGDVVLWDGYTWDIGTVE